MNKFPTQHLDPMRNIRPQSSNGANRRIGDVPDRDRGRRNWAGKRALPLGAVSAQSGRSSDPVSEEPGVRSPSQLRAFVASYFFSRIDVTVIADSFRGRRGAEIFYFASGGASYTQCSRT